MRLLTTIPCMCAAVYDAQEGWFVLLRHDKGEIEATFPLIMYMLRRLRTCS